LSEAVTRALRRGLQVNFHSFKTLSEVSKEFCFDQSTFNHQQHNIRKQKRLAAYPFEPRGQPLIQPLLF
jgi:hypothetical protein